MISQSKNRVQAIKSKFENLTNENDSVFKTKYEDQLCKQSVRLPRKPTQNDIYDNKENASGENDEISKDNEHNSLESDSSQDESSLKANVSYLYKTDLKKSVSDTKKSLTRQTSDPGKKLHRSHAFRCDRPQKLSPKRHGSCNGRSETSDFALKMGERKLSKDRLKKLGNLLEGQMKKEGFVAMKPENELLIKNMPDNVPINSIPDSEVPKHILDQYAKVLKPKKNDADKQDAMTDSGVSSETENLEEDKTNRIRKLKSQFEPEAAKSATNLDDMNELCVSSETMRLERKNPHVTLTDTLKKALKQPLPAGPPPKKPPRVFTVPTIPENTELKKKDTKQMLEKLEIALQKKEAQKSVTNIYDVAETNLSVKKPKEIHYLCTEILDITNRTLLPNHNNVSDTFTNCFNSLNCAIVTNSTTSLPYTRLSQREAICPCNERRLSTFSNPTESKCSKCLTNDQKDSFRCHLQCNCRNTNSAFYIEKENIYDLPFVGNDCDDTKIGFISKSKYGTLNGLKTSKSLEDLRFANDDQKIYDVPCDISRPETPQAQPEAGAPPPPPPPPTPSKPEAAMSEFEKLRRNFESRNRDTNQHDKTVTAGVKVLEKPPLTKKPAFVRRSKMSKSSENLSDDFKVAKQSVETKFATEKSRRYKRNEAAIVSAVKKDNQLDMDRENLNRLMTEIYETVSAACSMENKPSSFPTDTDGSTSEDSVKLTRSLTEKRKNYVRRVSSRAAYLDKSVKTRVRHQTSVCSYSEAADNPYSTFRSWKSFRTSQTNVGKARMDRRRTEPSVMALTDVKVTATDSDSDDRSIDGKTGCVNIEVPYEVRDRLFSVCMLVGLNYLNGQAYVKSVFPNEVKVPPHIENLIFPETLTSSARGEWQADSRAQAYSLVLTDERGERSYAYCRRVLPEGATVCLPLCYCIIGKYRAPGFYYKVLQEIESHHGSSEVEIHSILTQLNEATLPNAGEHLVITRTKRITTPVIGDKLKSKTMPDARRAGSVERETERERVSECYDVDNNNSPKKITLNIDGVRTTKVTLKRPLEPRTDEFSLSTVLDCLGAGLLIKVFGSLLLERKLLIAGDKLSLVSMCMEGLQLALYPFVWQQPLISIIPSEIQRDVLEAPLPMLAGMLDTGAAAGGADSPYGGIAFDEGMLIDLSAPSKVIYYQGDESTILPTSAYKNLKTSLQMESQKHKDKMEDTKMRNVLISEAFLRFFVDILGDFWKYFEVKELMEDDDMGVGNVVFDKEAFIKNATSKQNQYFLEWFSETAMFTHFIRNMAIRYHNRDIESSIDTKIDLIDTPLPNFYELFDERQKSRGRVKQVEGKSNYKNAMNKKVRILKNKLRDLVA